VSHLLDVNLLLACAWQSHADHAKARAWLEKQASFATCALSQLGFLRVSMSPGYRAGFADALAALEDITSRRGAQFLADDLPAAALPAVTSHADTTDAYLVALAKAHGLKLSTLDRQLCQKPWAKGIAEDTLR
jgi:toxin-antitoxin system PIN domain toxin